MGTTNASLVRLAASLSVLVACRSAEPAGASEVTASAAPRAEPVEAGSSDEVPASETWREAEAGILENHVQLTSSERFRKAGECYFSPDGRRIIFQAIEREDDPANEERFYQMYVADLVFRGERVTGIEGIQRLSPPGSASTCGWFHPTKPGWVLFGCTVVPPANPDKTGYQRENSRYVWQFPEEMDIVTCELARADGTAATLERVVADPHAYLAECVVSADGRRMVYCEHKVDEGRSGGDLLVLDFETGRTVPVTGAKGYDGGPFFSPDGQRICYRSDRRGDDLLQIFVAELAFDDAGAVTGVEREFQLTDNVHVNWAPYWHPKGRHLVYATSEMGHENYEVFLVDADRGEGGETARPTKYGTRRRRVTHAARFDGLPVFNQDGSQMMWTSQRGADGSSQVWLADFALPLSELDEADESAGRQTPETLNVLDPETGLYFLYDTATHRLSVYDPKTHVVRETLDDAETQRAMELFREAGAQR